MFVDYIEMGKRIAKRRKELGLKQSEVNERAELSDKYLSNIENGKSIPSVDVLMKICTIIDTSPDYILLGAVEKYECKGSDVIIISKLKDLNSLKQKLVLNFITWLNDQSI